MQKHTIKYDEKVPTVIGLDILPKEGAFGKPTLFLDRKAKEIEFERIGIELINLKTICKAKEVTEEYIQKLCENSKYYEGKPEGVVIKNYKRLNPFGKQMFAKVVLDTFKEHNRAVFGSAKQDRSDTVKIVDEFCTNARIRKRILQLTNEGGHKLERQIMKYLPMSVVKDIFKEESEYLTRKCKTLHLDTMKKLISEKCLQEIDIMIYEKEKV